MKGLKPYPKYKPSGVEWLGDIPEGWDVKRLRFVSNYVKTGSTPDSEKQEYFDSGDIPWFTPGDFNEKIDLNDASKMITSKAIIDGEAKLFKRDSILLVGIGATLGKIGFCKTELSANQQINVIYINNQNVPRFYAYYLLAITEIVISTSNASTLGILNQEKTKQILCVVPFKQEQRAIASFLDRETGRIDAVIAKKQRLTELLREKRTSLITRAVTKGLDPNAPMKNSGVEWLGKIPRHWAVKRLKYVVSHINEKLEVGYSELPYIGLDHVESWTGRLIESNGAIESESINSLFKSGDVLFGKLRPYLAKSLRPDFDGQCTGELLVFRPKAFLQGFLFYFCLSEQFVNLVDSSTYGAKMPRANWDFIGNVFVPVPPVNEQETISRTLDKVLENIDSTRALTERSIKKLQEYRSALISAAVTGKIDVRK